MRRDAFVAWLLVIGTLLSTGTGAFLPGVAAAQMTRGRSERSDGGSIAREWELRGVALADARRLAVLEHRPSGRQQLLRVGDVLARGVAIAAIDLDRIVLDAQGRALTLRLGHGGQTRLSRPSIPARQARVSRPGIPTRPTWPSMMYGRRSR